jgi:hypothetical protein
LRCRSLRHHPQPAAASAMFRYHQVNRTTNHLSNEMELVLRVIATTHSR